MILNPIKEWLEMINIYNSDASINENGPNEYLGLDRFKARKKIIEHMKSLNLLVKEDFKCQK